MILPLKDGLVSRRRQVRVKDGVIKGFTEDVELVNSIAEPEDDRDKQIVSIASGRYIYY